MLIPLLVTPDIADAALRSGADALVLDLGGAAEPGTRDARRAWAAALMARRPRGQDAPMAVVRVASLASGLVDDDLDAVMPGAPEAVLLPGTAGARDLQHLAAKLAVREAERGLRSGRTLIVALPADTARGVLALPTLPGASPRLAALAWDAEALASDLGVGEAACPVRHARALLLIAAAAGGVPALDFTPLAGDLARGCGEARRDGFAGRVAHGPGELAAIASAFGRPLGPARGRGRPPRGCACPRVDYAGPRL